MKPPLTLIGKQTVIEAKRAAWYPTERPRHYSDLIRGLVLGGAMLYGFLAWIWIVYTAIGWMTGK